ncbi:MAG: host specificity protein [Rhodothermia bacterium]|nr:host specificity protein [Rhodothermia bacterium]
MKENVLKTRLLARKPCFGVISPTTDPTICEYMGLSGLDFYMIDGEHGAISVSDITNLVRACELGGCTPLARVGDLNMALILQYMDAGVMGIMMPGCSTVADVEKVVAAVKYPPLGKRGLGPVRSAGYMMKMPQAEYVSYANTQTLVLPQIEDLEAVKNLRDMVNVAGVDGFIIGPRDLAMSMGFYDGPAHPEVNAVITEIFEVVKGAGKIIGTVAGTADQAQGLIDKGATILLNSVQGLLSTAAKSFIQARIA